MAIDLLYKVGIFRKPDKIANCYLCMPKMCEKHPSPLAPAKASCINKGAFCLHFLERLARGLCCQVQHPVGSGCSSEQDLQEEGGKGEYIV